MSGERSVVNAFSMRWWRFDHYVLRDFFIRPAAHAKLQEYDLWQEYEDSLRDTKSQTVHHQLLEIGEMHSRFTRKAKYRQYTSIPKPLEESLLRFVTRWGLLGLAPERILAIHYKKCASRAGRLSHVREGGEWTSFLRGGHQPHRWAGQGVAHIGGCEPIPALDDGVVMWDDPTEGMTVSSINDLIRRFMPTMATHPICQALPTPLTHAWWSVYAEPWYEMAIAAANLSVHLAVIERFRQEGKQPINGWLASLSHYGSRWSPQMISLDGKEIIQRWTFRSMASALAEMCVQDEVRGRSTRSCANTSCRAFFSTGNRRARYCTRKCQNTAGRRARKKRA